MTSGGGDSNRCLNVKCTREVKENKSEYNFLYYLEPCYAIYEKINLRQYVIFIKRDTVELQWLEHFWDYENLFEAGVVLAIEGI